MMLIPGGIAAVTVAALILGIAMASGRQRNALRNGGGVDTVSYGPPTAHGNPRSTGAVEHRGHLARRGAPHPSPTITERQAREYEAMSGRFSSEATPEIKQWNAEQAYGRHTVR